MPCPLPSLTGAASVNPTSRSSLQAWDQPIRSIITRLEVARKEEARVLLPQLSGEQVHYSASRNSPNQAGTCFAGSVVSSSQGVAVVTFWLPHYPVAF